MNIKNYLDWKISKRTDFVDVIKQLDYKIGAEVGVWEGEYAKELLKAPIETLYLIDPWTAIGMTRTKKTGAEAFSNAMENLADFKDRIKIKKSLSSEAINDFEDNSLDFLYLDASHDYDNVKNDLEMWYNKIRTNGLFFGHDYNNRGYKLVKKAVDEFFGEENVNSTCNEKVKSWFLIK